MAPIGSELTLSQLMDALTWKLTGERKSSCLEGSSLRPTLTEVLKVEEKLALALCAVRYLRNAFSPINRCPVETLARIFEFLQPKELYSFRPIRHSGSNIHRWHKVTTVCQHWRQTAFAFPSLWRYIHLYLGSGVMRTDAYLHRSWMVPLRIYVSMGDGQRAADFESLAKHNSRIQEIHIKSRLNAGFTLFTFPAPSLHSLTLFITGTSRRAILPCLFSDHTPKLEKLAVQGFCSWPENHFQDLTHISLHDQDYADRTTLAYFLDFLRCSPRLEELSLDSAGPNIESFEPVSQRHNPVQFDHLRILEIGRQYSVGSITGLLHHFLVPSKVDIRVWGYGLSGYPGGDDLFALLCSFSALKVCDIATIRMTPFKESLPSKPQIIRLNDSTLDIHGSFYETHLLSMSRVFSLSTIHELWLTTPIVREHPSEGFQHFIQAMSSLTTLVTCNHNLQWILPALNTNLNYSFEQDHSHTPCGNLDVLHVYGSGNVLNLCRFAEQRAARGHPLRYLQGDGFNLEEAAELRQHIRDVNIVDTQHYQKQMLHPICPVLPSAYGWDPHYY